MCNPLIRLPAIVSILLVCVGLFAGVTASSQEMGGAPVVVTGKLEVLVTDYFEKGVSTTTYLLHVDNGPVYELQFSGNPPTQLSTGQRVTVKGLVEGKKLQVDALTLDSAAVLPSADSDMALH
ncbi:MAG: hypothetical protein U1F76_28600 [Candidatus Competibacteraceae bacterium]